MPPLEVTIAASPPSSHAHRTDEVDERTYSKPNETRPALVVTMGKPTAVVPSQLPPLRRPRSSSSSSSSSSNSTGACGIESPHSSGSKSNSSSSITSSSSSHGLPPSYQQQNNNNNGVGRLSSRSLSPTLGVSSLPPPSLPPSPQSTTSPSRTPTRSGNSSRKSFSPRQDKKKIANNDKSDADDLMLKELEQVLQRNLSQSKLGWLKRFSGSANASAPSTASLYNQIGNIHFRKDRMDAAMAAYKQAILTATDTIDSGSSSKQATDDLVSAYSNLGTIFWRTGDVRSAIHLLEQALNVHEVAIATAAASATSQSSAISSVSSGDPADPPHLSTSTVAAQIYHQLGLCYALEKNFKYAMEYMSRALFIRERIAGSRRDVTVGRTLDAMGRICYLQGNFKRALSYHQAAIRANAPIVPVLQNMVQVYQAQGQTEEAMELIKDIKRLQQNTQTAEK